MPCPFFEPQEPITTATYLHARLPLIDEYEGRCHANSAEPQPALGESRFRFCNHGYSRTECARFPQSELRSALRYSVVRESIDALHVLCVEERDHIPTVRATVEFDAVALTLAPTQLGLILQAQALAFCRSYAARFLRTS